MQFGFSEFSSSLAISSYSDEVQSDTYFLGRRTPHHIQTGTGDEQIDNRFEEMATHSTHIGKTHFYILLCMENDNSSLGA